MTVTSLSARSATGRQSRAGERDALVAALRTRLEQAGGTVARVPLPMVAELRALAQLHTGGSYRVDDTSLALALAAAPSQAGGWTAVVGVDDLGVEAAAEAGLELARTVLVPHPGEGWLEVTAALADVVGVVWLRPPGRVREAVAAKLAARLRKRSATLLVQGEWPGCEAQFRLAATRWYGAEAGHGRLRARQAVVECRRRSVPARTAELWLPADPLLPQGADETGQESTYETGSYEIGSYEIGPTQPRLLETVG